MLVEDDFNYIQDVDFDFSVAKPLAKFDFVFCYTLKLKIK